MKHKSYLLFSILALLSLLLSGAAAYQLGPEPPEPPQEPEAGSPSFEREAFEPELDLKGPAALTRSKPAPPAGAPLSPNVVTPGKTGLSFRYLRTIGTTGDPYNTGVGGDDYLNGVEGIDIGSGDKLYVAESEGARVLRYDSAQHADLVLGSAGIQRTDETHFNWPNDVLAEDDGDFWVADYSRIMRIDSTGERDLVYPANPTGDCNPAVDILCNPYGLAFDSDGRLYVSDYEYHVVQVFTLSGGTPVLSTTIGMVGEPGPGNDHFNGPIHIDIDGNDNLYVAEEGNHRVQKCSYSGGWSCTTFHGVTETCVEDDPGYLCWPYGVTVQGSTLYIADTGNWRVKSCDLNTAICDSSFITDVDTPTDVAVDSFGNLFVSQTGRSYVVSRFDSSGFFQEYYAGDYGKPYLPAAGKIYAPYGLAVDSSGNVYANERRGNRYLKYDSTGALVGSIGEPGISRNLPTHFSGALMGNPGVSAAGLLYLPDTNRNCVKIYDTSFVYQNQTIGTCNSSGDSGVLFRNPAGVAVSPLNGNIYVADRYNNKVKGYTSSLGYLGPLGGGSSGYGNGDYQFDTPIGIAIDRLGNIYVADQYNHRVQKYNSSGVFQYTIGSTDDCGWYYDELCSPTGVATDGLNRVYIAENWNNRVQVYDSSGAYLTTIGGSWGMLLNKDLRSPTGVAVARDGTVYVADHNNHRIQVFDPGVPFWAQVNLNGFANPDNGLVLSLEPFGDYLYAGTYNETTSAQLWRKSPSTQWSPVNQNGLGDTANVGINDLVQFGDYLYAGAWAGEKTGGEIRRSSDGETWELVSQSADGFGDPTNAEIMNLTVFTDTLFATTVSYTTDHGAEVWRSLNGLVWTQIEDDGFGDPNNSTIYSTAVFGDYLYMGTSNWDPNAEQSYGAEIWRCHDCDGADWDDVTDWGTDPISHTMVSAMTPFQGYLYVQAVRAEYEIGAEIFRCQACDGTDWNKVVVNGLGNPARDGSGALYVHDGWLYWAIRNLAGSGGLEIWRTRDGLAWAQVGYGGFGDANNSYLYYNQAVAAFNDGLYFATRNWANGGEIWQFEDKNIFLPLLKR